MHGCCRLVAKSCPILCNAMDCSTPVSSVLHYLLLRFMSIESVMLSNHLILCHPLLLLPSIFPSFRIFFFKLFIFYWRIIALQNFVVFWQTSTWISHRYMYIPSLPSPSPSHPSRLIQSPCLSFLSHTANSCWPSILHIVIKFPCYSFHASHPLLPSPCVQKSVLCLSIATLHIYSSVPSF